MLPILLTILAVAASAAGAQANECRRPPSLSASPGPTLGRIAAPGRTAFVQDGLARPGCPAAGPDCRERAYLVAGDPVLLGPRHDSYVCATYRGAGEDRGRTGWLPVASVADARSDPVIPEDWLGTWTGAEARIRVRAGKGAGTLVIKGEATWGGDDPERVGRGGIHTGAIAGTVTPVGGGASFAVGANGTLPVEKGGADDCKVWLRRIGPWLVIDDNLACGGANVTFRGVYRHQP